MRPAAALFEPVPIQAVGARLRAARFEPDPQVPPQGVCVLLNGQTEFIEKYFEVIDELRGRGFAVAALDWRGQGGSQRYLSDDSRKSFVGDFAEYEDDLDTLLHWIVRPMLGEGEKPLVLAHSMGGHVLLRYLLSHPGSFRAGVLSAPMIGVSLRGQREWLVRLVTAWQVWRGNRSGWVWGMEERDPFRVSFATQLVTSDSQRFERTQSMLREHPDLRMAGATWGWLDAAFRSIDYLRPRAGEIATPLLMVGAGKDRICLTPQTRDFAARAHARYLEIEGAEHEILMERNLYRQQFWTAFDGFLRTQKHAAPQP